MTPTESSRALIRRLDEATVAQIAAGEVVGRPASVVKELIENALDAGAREVRVAVEDGGLARIEVSDDGEGIPAEELDLALERHATSKIARAEDLGTVRTLGFRGEALASIASVSRLTLSSRPSGSDAAAGVRPGRGASLERFSEGRPVGTTVRVEGLFASMPARRKFLKGVGAESLEVIRVVEREYLAHAAVGFTTLLNGQEHGRYPATSVLRDAASVVLGTEFLDQAIPLSRELGDGVEIDAVVAHPALSRGNSLGLFIAINGRPVESRGVSAAVRAAYQDYLPRTRFPVGVVHLRVPVSRVDVNVHPTKREVRLAGERELTDALRRAIRTSLQGAPELATPPAVASGSTGSTRLSRPRGPGEGLARSSYPADAQARGPVQRRFAVDPAAHEPARTSLAPGWELVGDLFHLYWVAAAPEGLVLIDQHAASERLLFDALRQDGRLGRQALVEPVRIELTAEERVAWDEHREAVEAAGFAVEPFGAGSFRVLAVPVFRGASPRPEAVRELLHELASGGRPTIPNGFIERRAATIACHAAVRGGDVITAEAMRRILDDLQARPEGAFACPHGRPIRILLPRGRIDQWFLRKGA